MKVIAIHELTADFAGVATLAILREDGIVHMEGSPISHPLQRFREIGGCQMLPRAYDVQDGSKMLWCDERLAAVITHGGGTVFLKEECPQRFVQEHNNSVFLFAFLQPSAVAERKIVWVDAILRGAQKDLLGGGSPMEATMRFIAAGCLALDLDRSRLLVCHAWGLHSIRLRVDHDAEDEELEWDTFESEGFTRAEIEEVVATLPTPVRQ